MDPLKMYIDFVAKILRILHVSPAWYKYFIDPEKVVDVDLSFEHRVADLFYKALLGVLITGLELLPLIFLFTLQDPLSFLIAILVGIILLVIGPVNYIIYSAFSYAISKYILQGKGGWLNHLNAEVYSSLNEFSYSIPFIVLVIPIKWMSYIPVIGIFFDLLSSVVTLPTMLVVLYAFYARYRALKKIHGFSKVKGIVAAVVPTVIYRIIVVMIVAALVFGFYMFATGVRLPITHHLSGITWVSSFPFFDG